MKSLDDLIIQIIIILISYMINSSKDKPFIVLIWSVSLALDYPYFGYLRGKYTVKDLQELDEYGASLGVELVPCIETLDHLGRVLRWDAFNNIQDGPSNINVGEEATYEFIEEMIKTCRKCYKTNATVQK